MNTPSASELLARIEALERRPLDQLAPNPFAVELAGLSAYLQVLGAAKRQLAQYGSATVKWVGKEQLSEPTSVITPTPLVAGARGFLTARRKTVGGEIIWFPILDEVSLLGLTFRGWRTSEAEFVKPEATVQWLVISPGP